MKDSKDTELGLAVFKPYSPQLPLDTIEGMRVVKCLYKTNKATGRAAGTNSFTHIPDYIDTGFIASHSEQLAPVVIAWLQEQEAGLVKKMHLKGGDSLAFSDISFDSLLEYIVESSTSDRLLSKDVEEWFDTYMLDKRQCRYSMYLYKLALL